MFGIQVFRTVLAALGLMVVVVTLGTASAQQPPSGTNPTAMSVKEDQLLRELNKLQGRVSIPDGKASLLEQPQGRDYRGFREGALPWIGGIAVLGMLLALAAFYFSRGRIALEPDEQVTFTTASGGEYDVARKDWGFYATPSTNGRLKSFGLRAALVLSGYQKLFVVLVESGKEDAFLEYVQADKQRLLCWLDDDASVTKLAGDYGA